MEIESSEKREKNAYERVHFSASNKMLVLIICIGLFIGFVLKLFVFEILTVSGVSMVPALNDGDHLFVSKVSYGLVEPYGDSLLVQWKKPRRGDIVIYLYNNKIVVKRCVAVSGDLLEYSLNTEYNHIMRVQGTEIELTELQYLNLKDSPEVPEGYILAIGDNYAESVDSRSYGFVSERNILGKVLCK